MFNVTHRITSMRRHLGWLVALVLTWPILAQAEWVQVIGKATIQEGMYDQARLAARDDALQKAVLEFGTHVSSRQKMENGVIKLDQLEVSSRARVNRSRIQSEYIYDGVLHLHMNVDVETAPVCPTSQASQYKKKVAVLGFSLQSPEQARLGNLHDIERGLANALNHALHRQGGLVVYESSEHALYGDTINAPSGFNQARTLTKASDFAKQMGAQFVVSGVVRNLGVVDEDSFRNSYWQKLMNLARQGDQSREFSMDLFVHDGFSGAIVWQRNFTVQADWEHDQFEKIGFGSAEFWQDEYGQAIAGMIDKMAFLVHEQLRCQPFMTRISRVDGKTLHFSSGASTGIRPGDRLALYRTFSFRDADMLSDVELSNVKTALTVSQVHPNFGSGTISVDPGRLNIQEDDLLIAW